MRRREAIDRLNEGQEILRRSGVRSLAIFGSTARDEAGPDSDLDVLLELDDRQRFSLVDLSEIKFLIGELVGGRVDLALRGRFRPAYRAAIEKDVVPVFRMVARRTPVSDCLISTRRSRKSGDFLPKGTSPRSQGTQWFTMP
ncbi:MAG TPA: nucleotidyltransferase domain-containing protein [Rhizomicrobium sp.]|jgi:hypothetical protein|nr:nucleotidyltransferase domain-containing protein [Rhizomicrobium sp.]